MIFLIKIKNLAQYKGPGEYIGRFNYYHKLEASPIKNPYNGPKNTESNLKLVKKFKKFLEDLPEDSPEWKEIRRLQYKYEDEGELILICWCDPLPCHGEIIRSAILGEIHPKSEGL